MKKEYILYAALFFGFVGCVFGVISDIRMGAFLFSSPWLAASFVIVHTESIHE